MARLPWPTPPPRAEADPSASPRTEFSLDPAPSEPVFAAFFGDSYSAGAGATAPANRWTSLVAAAQGWTEWNYAQGGTGYLTDVTDGRGACGKNYCSKYIDAINAVSNRVPNIVVISGGRNDGTRLVQSESEVEYTIMAAAAKWPAARIVVTSPVWDSRTPDFAPDAVNTVRAAAAATGATFVDLGAPLEGHPEWITDDDVHPNDLGYAQLAAAFTDAWNRLPAS